MALAEAERAKVATAEVAPEVPQTEVALAEAERTESGYADAMVGEAEHAERVVTRVPAEHTQVQRAEVASASENMLVEDR